MIFRVMMIFWQILPRHFLLGVCIMWLLTGPVGIGKASMANGVAFYQSGPHLSALFGAKNPI